MFTVPVSVPLFKLASILSTSTSLKSKSFLVFAFWLSIVFCSDASFRSCFLNTALTVQRCTQSNYEIRTHINYTAKRSVIVVVGVRYGTCILSSLSKISIVYNHSISALIILARRSHYTVSKVLSIIDLFIIVNNCYQTAENHETPDYCIRN